MSQYYGTFEWTLGSHRSLSQLWSGAPNEKSENVVESHLNISIVQRMLVFKRYYIGIFLSLRATPRKYQLDVTWK